MCLFSRSSLSWKSFIFFQYNRMIRGRWHWDSLSLTFCASQALREYTKPMELEPGKNKTKWISRLSRKQWRIQNSGMGEAGANRHFQVLTKKYWRAKEKNVVVSISSAWNFYPTFPPPQLHNDFAQIPRPFPALIGGGVGRPTCLRLWHKTMYLYKNGCCTDLLFLVLHSFNHIFFNHSF